MTKIVGAFRALLINKNKQTKKLTVRKIYNHYLLSGAGVLKDPNPFSSLIDESHEKNFLHALKTNGKRAAYKEVSNTKINICKLSLKK